VEFDPPLVPGRLIRRYKRFLTDVELDDGSVVVAHCTNTGSLLGCLRPGSRVLLQPQRAPHRKLAWTWQLVRVGRNWVGIDTSLAVPLVLEALQSGQLAELQGYERAVREVRYGAEGRSRIDILLSRGGTPRSGRGQRVMHEGDERVYVEVKNTTLTLDAAGRRMGAFPDAVTERGRKHLHELMHVVQQGHRAAMVYCLQRSDPVGFTPADNIDPKYGEAFRQALEAGVEAYALAGRAGPRRVVLDRRLPLMV
jgi:sugar fermentation stimulation protein A